MSEDAKSDSEPKVTESRHVYRGSVIDVRVDRVLMPEGNSCEREVVEHSGAVVVAAVDDEENVFLVTQYRHAVRGNLLEFPAGTLEDAEEPEAAARRELEEEAGLVATRWDYLGSFYSSPGFLREELHAYLARGLRETCQNLDDDEDIRLQKMPLGDLLQDPNRLHDAKSLAVLALLQRRLDAEAS